MSLEAKREHKRDIEALRIDRDDRGDEAMPAGSPGSGRRGARNWGWTAAFVLLAATIAAVIFVLRASPGALRAVAIEAVTARLVSENEANAVLTASGYVVARRQSEVGPQTTGRVVWLGFDVGDTVTAGQVMARLDSAELDAQAAEARADLAQAERELARQRQLFAQGVTSRASFDAALAAEEAARARSRFVAGQIANTSIRAPFDGVVTVRRAELGEIVSPAGFGAGSSAESNSVAVVTDMTSLEVEADVSETNLARLSVGMPAEIHVEAYPDEPFPGELRQVVPTADRQKGVVQVKVRFAPRSKAVVTASPADSHRVLPEMSARVTFLSAAPSASSRPPRVMVPSGAVLETAGGASVLVVEGDRVVQRAVTLGAPSGNQVEIRSGLSGGEMLALGAARELEAGTRVKVIEEEK